MNEITKRLKIKGAVVAYYEMEIDVLFIKMVDKNFSEEEAIQLISDLEKTKFRFVSYLNVEGKI